MYCSAVVAQETARPYPIKPVRVVIPFPPGSSDVVARAVTQRVAEKLSQPFVIDYRPGATGVIGTDAVAKAPADGYTLLFATGTFSITAATLPKLPFDTVKDFAPVAHIGGVPMVLAVHPALPVKTVKEFIALAKARPGQLDYATVGAGGGYHLSTLTFARQHNLQFNHVPYKGSAPALIALIGGEVQFMFPNVVAISPYLGTGRVRALALASDARSPLAPEMLTMKEAGIGAFREGTWYGMLAPRATPGASINLLHQEIMAATQLKDIRAPLEKIGVIIAAPSTPGQFADFIRADIDKWLALLKTMGRDTLGLPAN